MTDDWTSPKDIAGLPLPEGTQSLLFQCMRQQQLQLEELLMVVVEIMQHMRTQTTTTQTATPQTLPAQSALVTSRLVAGEVWRESCQLSKLNLGL